MTRSIIQEVIQVGKAGGIGFDTDIADKTIRKAREFPYETRTSFQRDYEKKDARNEGDIFGGTMMRLAKEYQVSIPFTTKVYEALGTGDGSLFHI
jgi:2-dehydropantoate 2-reductase